jgi:hypothetical protein
MQRQGRSPDTPKMIGRQRNRVLAASAMFPPVNCPLDSRPGLDIEQSVNRAIAEFLPLRLFLPGKTIGCVTHYQRQPMAWGGIPEYSPGCLAHLCLFGSVYE